MPAGVPAGGPAAAAVRVDAAANRAGLDRFGTGRADQGMAPSWQPSPDDPTATTGGAPGLPDSGRWWYQYSRPGR
jgi:hypothetical protein